MTSDDNSDAVCAIPGAGGGSNRSSETTSAPDMPPEAACSSKVMITLTALTRLLGLRPAAVRRLGIRPARRGSRRGEARYVLSAVIEELSRRNQDMTLRYPAMDGRFLSPREASVVITDLLHGRRHMSDIGLAKMRYNGGGPDYVRVTPKAVRYCREDLISWAAAYYARQNSE